MTNRPLRNRTRRDFLAAGASLGAASLGAGALTGFTRPRLQENQPVPDEEKIGFAIVGLGGYALNQILPNFKHTRWCKPAFLVTGDPETKGKEVAGEYGIDPKNVCTYDQMTQRLGEAEDVQVVYVITPVSFHKENTLAAFAAGKHVLCEKPMAGSAEDCDAMIKAGQEAGKQLMIGYRCQYEPYNLRAIEMARSGEFGKVVQVNAHHLTGGSPPADAWRLDPERNGGGGPLMDYGIYGLQAARYIIGEEPTHVSGMTYWPEDSDRFGPGAEARCVWQMQFPGGATASLSTGWDGGHTNRYRVGCEKGWYEMEPATGYGGHRMFRNGRGGREEITDQVEPGNQFAAQLDHMAQCVKENKTPRTPGEEGRQDVYLMKKIYESAETGRTLEVENRRKA